MKRLIHETTGQSGRGSSAFRPKIKNTEQGAFIDPRLIDRLLKGTRQSDSLLYQTTALSRGGLCQETLGHSICPAIGWDMQGNSPGAESLPQSTRLRRLSSLKSANLAAKGKILQIPM